MSPQEGAGLSSISSIQKELVVDAGSLFQHHPDEQRMMDEELVNYKYFTFVCLKCKLQRLKCINIHVLLGPVLQ